MEKTIATILLLLSSLADAEVMTLTVDRATDGDTIRALNGDGEKIVVRLLGVDTPEKKFANESQGQHAIDATNYINKLIPRGSLIRVETGETVFEKWNRILGTVYFGETNINLELLKAGMGMPYFIAPFETSMVDEYREACTQAEAKGLGVFNPKKRLKLEPYIFRMKVSNKESRNLVGDSVTGEFFRPQKYRKVPICNRVFFYDANEAMRFGYTQAIDL